MTYKLIAIGFLSILVYSCSKSSDTVAPGSSSNNNNSNNNGNTGGSNPWAVLPTTGKIKAKILAIPGKMDVKILFDGPYSPACQVKFGDSTIPNQSLEECVGNGDLEHRGYYLWLRDIPRADSVVLYANWFQNYNPPSEFFRWFGNSRSVAK